MTYSPCYQCEKRTLTCHDDCPRYLEDVAKIRERKKKKRGAMLANDLLREGAEKMMRKKNRKTKV